MVLLQENIDSPTEAARIFQLSRLEILRQSGSGKQKPTPAVTPGKSTRDPSGSVLPEAAACSCWAIWDRISGLDPNPDWKKGCGSARNNRKPFILTFNPQHTNTGGMLLRLLQSTFSVCYYDDRFPSACRCCDLSLTTLPPEN